MIGAKVNGFAGTDQLFRLRARVQIVFASDLLIMIDIKGDFYVL
jgi:hypothetical protein